MGKIVKFSIVDGSGAAVPGQKLTAAGIELTTSAGGLAQALLDDGNARIEVNGVIAYDGPVDGLRSMETITTSGKRQV